VQQLNVYPVKTCARCGNNVPPRLFVCPGCSEVLPDLVPEIHESSSDVCSEDQLATCKDFNLFTADNVLRLLALLGFVILMLWLCMRK